LNYLELIRRLLSNEENIIRHKNILPWDGHLLAGELSGIQTENALKHLDWLLYRKESFKADKGVYICSNTMKTPFGE